MNNPDFWVDAIRSVFAFIDSVGYLLLTAVYKIFFTVANAQLLEGDVVTEFFSRIQLILGVLMTFKLAITALNIIINPDMFKDKEKGAGKVLMRIVVSLILLTLVIPVNIPENEDSLLNQQIRNNGFLFGFLYQFQNSVLQDNILGKLILGSDVESNEGNYGDLNNLSDIGMTLSTTVAQAFITPTLKDNVTNPKMGSDGRISEEDVACSIVLTDYEYGLPSTSYEDYLKYINDTCDYDGKEVYIFNYTPFAGLVCSLIMTVIIIGFTLDIAVRAIKLAILRLIAPIPIISYISPGQEKNGAFGNWVKTLASTYIGLFLRLAIIYFGAYVILIISEGGITIWQNTPDVFTNLFSTVFIIIGVLVFMKDAPKFFQDMLGLKGDGKLFSGIGTMLGAAALTGGLAGSVIGSARTGWSEGQELGYGTGKKLLRAVGAGAGGLIGGGFAGAKALATADKKQASAVFAAMQKRQALRGTGSTWLGRTKSGASALFLGSSLGGRASKQVELYDSLTKAAQAHKSMVEDEALKDTNALGYLKYIDTNTGKEETMVMNYREFEGMYESARAAGEKVMAFTDAAGNKVSLDVGRMNTNRLNDFKESQSTAWLIDQYTKKPEDRNAKVVGTATDLEYAASKVDMNIDPYQYGGKPTDETKGIKGVIGASINESRKIKSDARMQYKIQDDKAINNTNK